MLACLLFVAGCSGGGSGGGGAAPPPVVSPLRTPAPGTPLTVGPVVVTVPKSMTPVDSLPAREGQTVGGYRSTPDPQGKSGVVLVTVSDTAARSPKAEAEALVGQKKDVQKATGVRMAPVAWPGFSSAVGVEYDDAPASAGAPSPLHGLVVIAQAESGQLVNVTALAPRPLFDRLDLASAVASLRLAGSSS